MICTTHLQKNDFIYCEFYLHIIFLYIDTLLWAIYNISLFPISSAELYKNCDSSIISIFIIPSVLEDASINMLALEVSKPPKAIFTM